LESFPFTVFLIYSKMLESRVTNKWEAPLITGGCIAILSLTILLNRKVQLNSILLGINIYLITACSAIIFDIFWVQRIYEKMTVSAVIVWIIISIIVTLFIYPKRFIGINHLNWTTTLLSFFSLLIAAVIALVISIVFKDNSIFSEIIPFAGIFTTQHFLKRKYAHCGN